MQYEKLATFSNEELEEARRALTIHKAALRIYELLDEPTYVDGEPVTVQATRVADALSAVEAEQARRTMREGDE